ncbi:hypothetical protein DFH28DRAFT_527726 [Melampsora americana]|nr:hypothetical protein DFH28DRAFT_527726 [Melampsora americana]
MKFGQIFIYINLFVDHQASGSYLKIPQINTAASPNTLAYQTTSGSSGVVFSVLDEELAKSVENANLMRSQVKSYSPPSYTSSGMPQLGHRILEQELDNQVTTTTPIEGLESVQAPSPAPSNTESREKQGILELVAKMVAWTATALTCVVGADFLWHYFKKRQERYDSSVFTSQQK